MFLGSTTGITTTTTWTTTTTSPMTTTTTTTIFLGCDSIEINLVFIYFCQAQPQLNSTQLQLQLWALFPAFAQNLCLFLVMPPFSECNYFADRLTKCLKCGFVCKLIVLLATQIKQIHQTCLNKYDALKFIIITLDKREIFANFFNLNFRNKCLLISESK